MITDDQSPDATGSGRAQVCVWFLPLFLRRLTKGQLDPESDERGRGRDRECRNEDSRTDQRRLNAYVVEPLCLYMTWLSDSRDIVVLSGGFLYSMFSWSALVAIATIPLMTPFTAYVARITYRECKQFASHMGRCLIWKRSLGCDKDLAKARDARIGAMREVLMAVKVVKVFQIFTSGCEDPS